MADAVEEEALESCGSHLHAEISTEVLVLEEVVLITDVIDLHAANSYLSSCEVVVLHFRRGEVCFFHSLNAALAGCPSSDLARKVCMPAVIF